VLYLCFCFSPRVNVFHTYLHPLPFWYRRLELPRVYAARRGKQCSVAVLDSLFVFPLILWFRNFVRAEQDLPQDLHIGSGTAIRAVPVFDLL